MGAYPRGIGKGGVSRTQAPPTAPSNGSGGPGVLPLPLPRGGVNVAPAFDEVSDVMTGRITLGLINVTILVMIGLYVWTRSAQGGG